MVTAMTVHALALAALLAAKPAPAPAAQKPVWLGDELPLPLAVRTPDDLAYKALTERQYLTFNLLAEAKLAWDNGDWSKAAARWEALLKLPDLSPKIAEGVRPFAIEARKRAGGAASTTAPLATASEPVIPPTPVEKPEHTGPVTVTLRGTVTGGGAFGPGGAVVWLERRDGKTPAPKPAKNKVIVQRNKAFIPRVLAVPAGTTVDFRNDDDLYHDVFSLSKPNAFDLGLYKSGAARSQKFDSPGPVSLLCNIHASMQGWVYVVNSPWYAQADGNGSYSIRGVPRGEYVLHAWSESASKPTEQNIKVGELGAVANIEVGGDASKPAFVPDKYGKSRQVQLGY